MTAGSVLARDTVTGTVTGSGRTSRPDTWPEISPMKNAGELVTHDGVDPVVLPQGGAGLFLQSNGDGTWSFAAPPGSTGVTGASGQTGASGASGNTGAGDDGASGKTGETGDTGLTGATGQTSNTGASGASGSSGSTGAMGQTSNTGASGSSGASGATGASGASGETGATGTLDFTQRGLFTTLTRPDGNDEGPTFLEGAVIAVTGIRTRDANDGAAWMLVEDPVGSGNANWRPITSGVVMSTEFLLYGDEVEDISLIFDLFYGPEAISSGKAWADPAIISYNSPMNGHSGLWPMAGAAIRIDEEFFGDAFNRWQSDCAGTGCAVAMAGVAGGAVEITSGDGAGDWGILSDGCTGTSCVNDQVFTIGAEKNYFTEDGEYFMFRFNLDQTLRTLAFIGLGDPGGQSATASTHYVALEADDSNSNFMVVFSNGSAGTPCDTGIALDTAEHTVHFVRTGTASLSVWIDWDTDIGRDCHLETNLPSEGMPFVAHIERRSGGPAANKSMKIRKFTYGGKE